jgi:hypothetical protein
MKICFNKWKYFDLDIKKNINENKDAPHWS